MGTPDNHLGTDSRLKRYESLVDMIGDADNPTPIVALQHLAPAGVDLFVKLEWVNPFGSIKDRAAKRMLAGLAERGELEGRTVLEPTSGNTGIALAALCALEGRPMRAIVPASMPAEKSVLLRAFGAEVVRTPAVGAADRHPMDVAMDMAEQTLAASDDFVMPNQYDNPDNARAHYETTGPEIWAQTGGRVRYFFAGLGTGGTISGAGRYLKERDPSIKVIAIEPVAGHRISGLKNMTETAEPAILDRDVIDEIVYVDDGDTLATCRAMHRTEALLVGSTGAACLAGALRWLRENGSSGVAVAVAPDTSQKAPSYLEQMLAEEE
ncbi:MAG: cysteine synthase family protein [Coriobacteriia bacterium]|nr:cysteine synthase family protein [Coriobacteriia bacterium]